MDCPVGLADFQTDLTPIQLRGFPLRFQIVASRSRQSGVSDNVLLAHAWRRPAGASGDSGAGRPPSTDGAGGVRITCGSGPPEAMPLTALRTAKTLHS